MAKQENIENKTQAKSAENADMNVEKAKIKSKTAKKARNKAQEPLDEVQEIQSAEQIHSEKINAEASLKMGLAENMELSPKLLAEERIERRISFIVRLTVNEQGEPRRTEIEHTQTRKKESFPTLDGDRLAGFIKACINPETVEKSVLYQTSQSGQSEIALSESLRHTSSLTVSEIRVFSKSVTNMTALTFSPRESFMIQVRFRLQNNGSVSHSYSESEAIYEMTIYANKVATKESELLSTFRGNMINGIFENTVQIEVPGLLSGIYRLTTLVTLQGPIKAAGYYEGPIIHIN